MSVAASLQAAPVNPQASVASTPNGLLQRKCACGSSKSPLAEMCDDCQSRALQRKLAIGTSDDPLEREADQIADQVLTAPADAAVSDTPPCIQGFAGQAAGPAGAAPASVDHALADSGRPLEPALREDMEQRFGYDFSRVRVHSGAAAEQSARDVNASAYTLGHDIVFGAGRFAPEAHQGRRLIAHELTHVLQQGGGARRVQRDEKKRGGERLAKKDVVILLESDEPLKAEAVTIAPEATTLKPKSPEDLAKKLKALEHPIAKLYFIGHSLPSADIGFTDGHDLRQAAFQVLRRSGSRGSRSH